MRIRIWMSALVPLTLIGCVGPAVGFGSKATGNNSRRIKSGLHRVATSTLLRRDA